MTYPVAADAQFDQWRRLGEPGRTPFTVFLVRRGQTWFLARSYFGVQEEGELMAHARAVLQGTVDVVSEDQQSWPKEPPVSLPLDPARQLQLAQRFLSKLAGRAVQVEAVDLANGVRVFEAVGSVQGAKLYARVAKREPVCHVCHAVYFLFAFDSRGRVRGFEPIYVTKYGNEEWDAADASFMDARLTGRKLENLSFDAEVDAVSRATMSSALIFDEVRRTSDLLKLLRERE
jgi:hypothetical protein